MNHFRKHNLHGIKDSFTQATGVELPKEERKFTNVKTLVVVAVLAFIMPFSAGAAVNLFSGLEGDSLSFSPQYLGKGKFAIEIENKSDKELQFQETLKLMKWSGSVEIEGDKDKVVFEGTTFPPHSKGVMTIDLSTAYDVENLEKKLPQGDWYYLILTNNNFLFGQDWQCSVVFDESHHWEMSEYAGERASVSKEEELESDVIAQTKYRLTMENWIWPTKRTEVSRSFGIDEKGFYSEGINIAGETGDTIFAVADGMVLEIGYDSSKGNYLVLDVGNDITVYYGHLKEIEVYTEETVKQGTKIATMGQSGMATGPNLYFKVEEGNLPINILTEE